MKNIISKALAKASAKLDIVKTEQKTNSNITSSKTSDFGENFIIETEQYKIIYTKSYFSDCKKFNKAI